MKKPLVLAIDDTPGNLLALESLRVDQDYDLATVSSGKEALKVLLEREVDLIILDVQMPEMNGFELAEIIKKREKTRDTPIIFTSAYYTDETDVFKGYEMGGFDYLTKPFDPLVLKSKINSYIRLFQKNSRQDDGPDKERRDKYLKLMKCYLQWLRTGKSKPVRLLKETVRNFADNRYGAKDVLTLHIHAVEKLTGQLFTAEAREFSLEARLLLIEVLGELCNTYLTLTKKE